MTKEKDDEEEELREEALAEWVSRGRAAQDFTMEKMIKLWDEEDEGKEEDDEDLEDKQELMKGYQMLGPLVDQAKDAARQFKNTAIVEGKKALETAWKYAELPPLRDRRLLRQHVVHVLEMDTETQKYSLIHQRIMEQFNDAKQMEEELHFGLKKRNKRQGPLLNRFQELKAEADRVQQAQRMGETEQRRQERIDKIMQEKQRQLEEKKEKAVQLLVQRRQRNLKFWQKQLEEAREFAEKQTYEQERNEEFEKKVEQMKGEMRMVEEEESVDAMRAFERLQMTSSIGIFDTAFEPGEWNSASEGGHQTGLVGISTTRGFSIENEQRRIELSEIQSKVTSLREKLEQVEQAKSNLGLDMRTILERKDHILQEIKQVRTEQDDLNGELAGPPRRDPSEHEKQQFHTLVTRRAKYMKQLGDLDSRIAHIQKRAAIVQRSEASLLPMLRETEEKLTEIQAQVDIIEKERHDLPVVIGKAISQSEKLQILPENDEKITVSKPFVNPIKLLNQVTMESKFEILQGAVTPVNEHYKKAKTQAVEAWKVTEFRALAEQDLDSAKARLVMIRDRFVGLQNSALRSDIVHAIHKYHERKAMASAEMEMEEYLRQVELEAMKTKYSKMIEDRNRFNDKAARRREIKHGKNEQHRLHREWRQIKIEDELAMQIRENERARALAEALERHFDKYLADQMAQGKISAQMEASRLEDRLREVQQVAAEKHRAFTMKMVQERMIASVETFYALSRAEVEWMDAIERTKFWNQRSSLLEENLAKMEPELKRINEEREHVVNDAKAKREFADKCKKRIEDADSSLLKAIQEKEMAMLKNVVGKMKFASKSVVSKMEQDLAKQRVAAAKFHTLDRR
ncbi:hypothetical protein JG688_00003147 [Phytophthora aleatoria]|uniref:Uncharacterized protein n=1 Tax=Phytophthora aleatoria TaxID=2496075 RepID=A0A8J5IZS6_9STRA|nr:hypothetical protein JG688_00003147 [Phytophthora aleatoria]